MPVTEQKELSKNQALTTREKEILDFIREKIWNEGFPPTVREICRGVNLHSPSTVHGYLSRLEEMGVIRRNSSRARSIEIVNDTQWRHKRMTALSLVRTIKANRPIITNDYLEASYFSLDECLSGEHRCFIFIAQGDSMAEAGIRDGDYLIITEQDSAQNGDIVIVNIEHEDAVVRRFYKNKDGTIQLQAAEKNTSPVISANISIRGKVIGLYRHF